MISKEPVVVYAFEYWDDICIWHKKPGWRKARWKWPKEMIEAAYPKHRLGEAEVRLHIGQAGDVTNRRP